MEMRWVQSKTKWCLGGDNSKSRGLMGKPCESNQWSTGNGIRAVEEEQENRDDEQR